MNYAAVAILLTGVAGTIACSDGQAGAPAGPSGFINSKLHHEASLAGTVVITDDGFEPDTLAVAVGTRVTFINQSSVDRWVRADPHEPTGHNECSQLDLKRDDGRYALYLAPGQSGQTAVFNVERKCDYHDHLGGADPDEGRIRVED